MAVRGSFFHPDKAEVRPNEVYEKVVHPLTYLQEQAETASKYNPKSIYNAQAADILKTCNIAISAALNKETLDAQKADEEASNPYGFKIS